MNSYFSLRFLPQVQSYVYDLCVGLRFSPEFATDCSYHCNSFPLILSSEVRYNFNRKTKPTVLPDVCSAVSPGVRHGEGVGETAWSKWSRWSSTRWGAKQLFEGRGRTCLRTRDDERGEVEAEQADVAVGATGLSGAAVGPCVEVSAGLAVWLFLLKKEVGV